ncbi:MAG: hypothetical protein K5873_07455 [Treponema sp.]|nr:hypothetical protein [Treponema sp.]
MKKIIAVFLALSLFTSAFAAEVEEKSETTSESSSSSSKGFDYHNLGFDLSVPIYFLGIGIETGASYDFKINENWHWDLGMQMSIRNFLAMGSSFNMIPYGSIWWKGLYLRYGLGLGIHMETGKAAFLPIDLKLGWQPAFMKKDSGLSFKMETGLFALTMASERHNDEYYDIRFAACFGVSLGIAYKF